MWPITSERVRKAWVTATLPHIAWAMSKPVIRKMVVERGYSSIARRSLIESAEFQGKLLVNGQDISKIYLDTIAMGARGYMKYRTVHVYPQVDKQIDIAIQKPMPDRSSAGPAHDPMTVVVTLTSPPEDQLPPTTGHA